MFINLPRTCCRVCRGHTYQPEHSDNNVAFAEAMPMAENTVSTAAPSTSVVIVFMVCVPYFSECQTTNYGLPLAAVP